jgi:hypothetical protein
MAKIRIIKDTNLKSVSIVGWISFKKAYLGSVNVPGLLLTYLIHFVTLNTKFLNFLEKYNLNVARNLQDQAESYT